MPISPVRKTAKSQGALTSILAREIDLIAEFGKILFGPAVNGERERVRG